MSREALHESLSAVMDNEADELELHRVLAASDDAELRSTWARYQVARAVMHKDLVNPHLDIASLVSAALADEEAPAAPAKSRRFAWRGVGRIAVAASVTVAVLAGVRLYNQSDVSGPQMAAQPAVQPSLNVPQQAAQGPAVLAGYSDQQAEVPVQAAGEAGVDKSWHEQRLPEYIRQHSQQAAFGNAASMEEDR